MYVKRGRWGLEDINGISTPDMAEIAWTSVPSWSSCGYEGLIIHGANRIQTPGKQAFVFFSFTFDLKIFSKTISIFRLIRYGTRSGGGFLDHIIAKTSESFLMGLEI